MKCLFGGLLVCPLLVGCAETITNTVVETLVDTVVVTEHTTDSVTVPLPSFRLEPISSVFARPVSVQTDAGGLLIADQFGALARIDGTVELDLTEMVLEDIDNVQGLLNLLVVDSRRFIYLHTRDGMVLVAEARGQVLDTLFLTGDVSVNHYGGGMAWYDDRLLIAFGDGGLGTGRLPGPAGKVIAIDPATKEREQLASGLRNPWRMALDGDTLWIADAGERLTEEINVLDLRDPGADFGWGDAEGVTCYVADCSGLTPPFYSYPTGPFCASVVGGAVYQRRFWFADFCEGWVRSVGQDGSVRHHFDLAEPVTLLVTPAPGEPPVIITQSGEILRMMPE